MHQWVKINWQRGQAKVGGEARPRGGLRRECCTPLPQSELAVRGGRETTADGRPAAWRDRLRLRGAPLAWRRQLAKENCRRQRGENATRKSRPAKVIEIRTLNELKKWDACCDVLLGTGLGSATVAGKLF